MSSHLEGQAGTCKRRSGDNDVDDNNYYYYNNFSWRAMDAKAIN